MGLNIGMYKFLGKNGKNIRYESKDELFDFIRHSGDREFAVSSFEKDFIGCDDPYYDETMLWRPKNPQQARDWIKKNIVEGNQKSLLDAVDLMEKDETLYLHNGY